ncbi:SDR family oxidoreductase [Corynebacterium ulcerans]|uniref:SDR family oxidoreductase n=1 Tax=Corynebacterium ulcerans TaxID=65058 RepID=UPI0018D7C1CB|nr:SDR family oxidoreductase [Corynebacterium ulcerans]MBH5298399.1 SDR family oxidoreductase [Corynebacterium ulcerans]
MSQQPTTDAPVTSNVRTLLILGATSEIGGQIARLLAPGRHVVLAARRTEALKDLSAELMDVGAVSVHTEFFDASDLRSHRKIIENSGDIEHAIVCFGILGDQETAEVDEHHAANIATIDYTAQIVALTVLSDRMKRNSQPSTITAFSSIAGWRARRANYVYGSTKAGLDAFCQGLSMALHATNLRMITARPGFVIGRMTAGMSPAPMSVTPDVVAQAVVREISTGRRSATLWIPRRLIALALLMCVVPSSIWRHMPR